MATFDGMEFDEIEQEEENDIKTEIGNFDISMPPKEFTCREEPGFYDLGGMLVSSCCSGYLFCRRWRGNVVDVNIL